MTRARRPISAPSTSTAPVAVMRDIDRGIALLRRAAGQQVPAAERELGFAAWSGMGAERNDTEAVAWFTLAAEKGDARASVMLANAYEQGRGVTQDRLAAWTWLLRAAENGHALARIKVARTYAGSTWGPRTDLTEAAKWFEAALDASDPLPTYRIEEGNFSPSGLAGARAS